MPQIDFAPTVSLLLGVPIPFGNLGTVRRRFCEIAHARDVLNRGAGDGWLDER
jgi:phosphatidylinositol glycan class O